MSNGLAMMIDALSALFAAGALAIVAMSWGTLPEEIPIHFDIHGEPDGWGGKETLLFAAAVCVGVFAAMSIAPRYPHLINVPGERTDHKISVSIDTLRVLKLITMSMIAWTIWGMTYRQNVGPWWPGFIAAICAALAIGYYKMIQDAR